MRVALVLVLRDKYILYGAVSIILIYLSPLLLFGEDSLISIHDVLGYHHILHKLLAESGFIFGPNSAQIPNLLTGIPRSVVGSGFDVVLWFHYWLEPFNAEVLHFTFKRLIAFWGMYRLLTNHFLSSNEKLVTVGVALTFGLLPFHGTQGLTVAGVPLALDAFLTIRKGKSRWPDWLIISLLPLASGFVMSFVYFLFFMAMIWLYDLLIKKDLQWKFLSAITLMTVLFLGVEHRIIYAMFFDQTFASLRVEFLSINTYPSFLYTLYKSLQFGLSGFMGEIKSDFYYAASLQAFFILPAAIIGIFILHDRRLKDKTLISLVLFTAFLCFSQGILKIIWSWEGMQPIIEQFAILRTYRFYRFYHLTPVLWYLIFALSLKLILNHSRRGLQIVCVLLVLQTGYAFFYHDEIQQRHNKPTYRAFYATKLFSAIDDFIGKNKATYKVASVGIHPSIALYNGFYTLDGYMNSYPLEYKHAFRKVIKKELDKNVKNKIYFDRSGVRCYVFASELTHGDWLYTKERNVAINNLELNIAAFKELGGEYIFSAVKINNHQSNQLKFVKAFEDEASAWKIFLYSPIDL